jgi:hypothetical protein
VILYHYLILTIQLQDLFQLWQLYNLLILYCNNNLFIIIYIQVQFYSYSDIFHNSVRLAEIKLITILKYIFILIEYLYIFIFGFVLIHILIIF